MDNFSLVNFEINIRRGLTKQICIIIYLANYSSNALEPFTRL